MGTKTGIQKKKIYCLICIQQIIFFFNCVDISRKELNYPHSFIFVGRFVEEKGIGYLVKAWDSIIDKCGWTLTLIGDGP
ncbi:glycosyltransferase family 4 protein [Algoriphagus boritolerans]|uniref:glycosyltransferase family 4 protein n=1 Tax=Algoriphagus boritolerans TaxID=308111 RepID=UPI000AE5A375